VTGGKLKLDLVYIVGPPGVGKSSVMEALTDECDRLTALHTPVPHDVLLIPNDDDQNVDVAIELGRHRDSFSGTDALGMSIQPQAVEWIATRPHRLILGEGARLATVGFLHAARSAGYTVHLVHLGAQDARLAERRRGRGSDQSPVWVRGATTRARRIMERMAMDADLHFVRTDGKTPVQLASLLTTWIPCLEVLR